jgi:hypothetical protein
MNKEYEYTGKIFQAIRNKKTLKWYANCPYQDRIISCYARHLNCPAVEIDETFTQQDDIDWLYNSFQFSIENYQY